MKTKKFALSVMATSVIAALSASVYADDTFSNSPFSMPGKMGESTTTSTVTVNSDLTKTVTQDFTTTTKRSSALKPNIVLLIDDSGSMRRGDGAGYGGRFYSVKHYLQTIFNTENPNDPGTTYLDAGNWGVTTFMGSYLYNTPGYDPQVNITFVRPNANLRFAANGDFIEEQRSSSTNATKSSIDNAEMNEGYVTPTVGAYLLGTSYLDDAIDYRCRKNYLIMFTDGQPESVPNFWQYKLYNLWNGSTSTSLYRDLMALNQKAINSVYGENRYWTTNGYGANAKYAGSANLYELSDLLHGRDLRVNGTDKAGKSWQDPEFPNQTIETYVISGWVSDAGHAENIIKMASPPKNGSPKKDNTGFIANNADEVKVAFTKIIGKIASENKSGVSADGSTTGDSSPSASVAGPATPGSSSSITSEESYAAVAPSISGADKGSLEPKEGAVVFSYPSMNASELRFYRFNFNSKTGDPDDPTMVGLDVDDPSVSNPNNYRTPSYTDRKVLVTKGSQAEWADSLPDSMFTNDYFALEDQDGISGAEWQKALIPWLARNGSDEDIRGLGYNKNVYNGKDDDRTSAYRIRSAEQRNIGDIVNSDLVSIGTLHRIKDIVNTADPSDPANQYIQRNRFLVTAANDGMAYIFEVNPKEEQVHSDPTYFLKLNYLPTQMVNEQDSDAGKGDALVAEKYKLIAHDKYVSGEKPHQYMMDGNITAQMMKLYDSANPGVAKEFTTYMIGNMGRAGRGAYALHLQQGSDVFLDDKDKVRLFELSTKTSSATHNDTSGLGFTIPTSTVGRVSGGNPGTDASGDPLKVWQQDLHLISFVSSGYAGNKDLKEQETALYLIETSENDAGTYGGTLSGVKVGDVRKISVPGGQGGLSAPTLLDANFDGVIDYVFAGDYAGNMYRFDVRDLNKLSVDRIFVSDGKWEDGKAPTKPITSAPAIARNKNDMFVVIWGTGTDLYDSDRKLKDKEYQQTIYGIFQKIDVKNTLDVVLDDNNEGIKTKDIEGGDLLEQTFIATKDDYRFVSNNDIRDGGPQIVHAGWKLQLDAANGERVVTKGSTFLSTAYLTSRWYETDGTTTGDEPCNTFDQNKIKTRKENINGKDETVEYYDNDPNSKGDRWQLVDKPDDDWSGQPAGQCEIPSDFDATKLTDATDEQKQYSWLSTNPGKWTGLIDAGALGTIKIPDDVRDNPSHPDYDYYYKNDPRDPCGKSVTQTGKYRQCLQTGGKRVSKYVCSQTESGEVDLKSAVIQINTQNGGAIFEKEAKKNNNSFMKWANGTAEFGKYGFAASLSMSGITNVSITGHVNVPATDLDGITPTISNLTMSGDASESGQLADLNEGNKVSYNLKTCAGKDSLQGSTVHIQNTKGNNVSVRDYYFGVICGVKRISWREIF
ncbi:MAG: hypothetical protein IK065_02480 [Neisseriaceae bacterium]|nr:hypothetical protein [Neisseriaceae bacterium]